MGFAFIGPGVGGIADRQVPPCDFSSGRLRPLEERDHLLLSMFICPRGMGILAFFFVWQTD